jgi:hypothetical protein
LYSSADIIRRMKSRRLRWAGHVECIGYTRNAHMVLVGKSERKRPVGGPGHRWGMIIKWILEK